MEHIKKPTQIERVLEVLRRAQGEWVDGMTFLRLNPPITQFHARIWELEKEGYVIEGRFIEGKNWKEYRLVQELSPKPGPVSPKISPDNTQVNPSTLF